MRNILAATLALSSALSPAMALASTSASDAGTSQPIRISTGVIAPKLVNSLKLDLPAAASWEPLPNDGQVTLSLVVDEKGQAHNVQVTRPLNRFWDARVQQAVEKAQYRPAMIDNQAIPMSLNLVVKIAR